MSASPEHSDGWKLLATGLAVAGMAIGDDLLVHQVTTSFVTDLFFGLVAGVGTVFCVEGLEMLQRRP
jgi:hypothetical protein